MLRGQGVIPAGRVCRALAFAAAMGRRVWGVGCGVWLTSPERRRAGKTGGALATPGGGGAGGGAGNANHDGPAPPPPSRRYSRRDTSPSRGDGEERSGRLAFVVGGLGAVDGDGEADGGTAAGFALDLKLAAVHFDQRLGQGQAETGALGGL